MATTPGSPASVASNASEPYARTRACTSPAACAAPAPGAGGASAYAERHAFSSSTDTPVRASSAPTAEPPTSIWFRLFSGSSNTRYPCGPERTGGSTPNELRLRSVTAPSRRADTST